MLFFSWLGKRRKRNSAKCRGPARVRLTLEQLEDRLAPAAGALDATFSEDGRLAVDIGPNSGGSAVQAMVVQPDGKTILAGGPLMQRLNTDGSLDTTFSNGSTDTVWDGGDGMATITGYSLTAVALQTDGKILAVGGGGPLGRILARLNGDGTPDLTWGANSLLALPQVGTGLAATGLLVQPDGKIVVGGYARMIVSGVDTGNDFAVVRLNPDGTLDTTFDGDGVRTVAIAAGNVSDVANAVALQTDGKIVLAGSSLADTVAVRLNADGSLDTGFDGDGIRTIAVSVSTIDLANEIAIQPNGKIILVGGVHSGPVGYEFSAVRLNADGSLDTTFGGGDGIAYPISPTGLAESVALTPAGKIVLAGSGPRPTPPGGIVYDGFCVAVLNSDGTVDTTFNGNGVLNFEPSSAIVAGNYERAIGVAITPAGKFLVGGTSFGTGFDLGGGYFGPFRSATLVRLNADGTFDATMDGDGIVLHTNRLLGLDAANAAALQPDGKIVLAGSSHYTFTTNTDFALARVNPDGTLDATFGVNGVLTTNLSGADVVNAVAIQPDGKIVAAGGSNQQASNLDTFAGVARYNSDGTLDTSFGVGGILSLTLGTTGEVFTALALQPNGKILLGGHIRTAGGTDWDFAVVRLNSDGSYDTSFGVGGLVRLALGITDFEFSLGLLPDGRILASGRSDSRAAVVRLNPDGTPDTTFGTAGVVYFSGSSFNGMAVQADGKLVFSGAAGVLVPGGGGTVAHLSVARLNADGSADTSFSGDGVQVVVIGAGSVGKSIAVSWDGRIIVGGSSGGNFVAVRLLSDGTPDPSFDDDGVATVDMAGTPYGFVDPITEDTLAALLVQPDGNIVLAGSISASPLPAVATRDFGIARINGGGVPPIDLQLSNGLIPENAGPNALVGTLTTIDPNTLDTHTYTLVSGAGDADNAQFVLVGNQLRAVASFDYESRSTYSVRVRSTDQTGYSVEEAFTITITNVNEAPTANNDAYSTTEDVPLTVALPGVLANDTDPEGIAVSAVLVSGPTNGTLSLAANGSFIYTPNPNFNGPDSFSYKANDGQLDSNVAVVNITVTPVNDAPTPNNDAYSTTEDTPLSIGLPGVLVNDTEPEGNALSAVLVSGPTNGTLSLAANGSFIYTPNPNFNGPDSFSYKANDGQLDSNVALVNITVNPVNDAPTANSDAYTTMEDTPLTITLPGVLVNDTDPDGDALSTVLVTGPAHGTLSHAANGSFIYTPGTGFSGVDSFIYRAYDGTAQSADALVTITVKNLVDVSGRVFDDKDNDGAFEPGDGDTGIGGVAVQLFNETSGALIASSTTAADGSYLFDLNLGAGMYKVVAAQPVGFLDGRETAGNLGGVVNNTQDSDDIGSITVGAPGTTADAVDYLFGDILPSQAQGLVWHDADNNGQVDFGETAIAGATIELTGLDDRGVAVNRSVVTDTNGVYAFSDLRPSNAAGYTIRELQPSGFADGPDTLGTVNGTTVGSGSMNDTFSGVVLPNPGSLAENYNFGERVLSEGGVVAGQTATIGFWQNKNGQNLLKSLNGSSTSTLLGDWLAANFPNMYGADAGAENLAGKTNAQVAAFYKKLFAKQSCGSNGPPKMEAQVLATAFAVYVTNQSLAGTTATSYGFLVTANGVGARTFNVGCNGAAFGVANNADVTVLDLLRAVNLQSLNGVLYDLNGDGDAKDSLEKAYRTMANNVFSGINESGDI